MACYAECKTVGNDGFRTLLLKFGDKYERAYVIQAFVECALPSESIRAITVAEARKTYDLNRFGRLPYADTFTMANPERPGMQWTFDAIEPSSVFDERQQTWQAGCGSGINYKLEMEC